MIFHGNTMVTMEFLWNTMASTALHGRFIWKSAVTSMEYHVFHGIPIEYHDTPYKLYRFSMENPWWISVRDYRSKYECTVLPRLIILHFNDRIALCSTKHILIPN